MLNCHKFPYTDFHELNLDFILHDIIELAENQSKFKLVINGNKVQLTDPEDKVISEITVPYATSANEANHANSSDSAGSATKATTDKNDKDITTYLASVSSENNVITFYNGAGEVVRTISLVTGENVVVTIKNSTSGKGSLFNVLMDMTMNPQSESDYNIYTFESDYSYAEILALLQAGNTVVLRHEHDAVFPDSQYDPHYDSCMPLELVYSSHPDLSIVQLNYITFGWFYGSGNEIDPSTASWKQFNLVAGSTDDTVKIQIIRE